MKIREQVISDCFQSWISKDAIKFKQSFALDAVYIESWGPAYRSLDDIIKWFESWVVQNKVIEWDIKNFWHDGEVCICEWFFKCECDGVVNGFNGVSIIEFDNKDKIVSLKEFQSKTPNYYPYE